MPVAAIYLRNETGNIETQRRILAKFVGRRNYTLEYEYFDREGEALILYELIDEIKSGNVNGIQALFVTSISRLYNPAWTRGRNENRVRVIKTVLKTADVQLITLYPTPEETAERERKRKEEAEQTAVEMEYMTRNMRTREY